MSQDSYKTQLPLSRSDILVLSRIIIFLSVSFFLNQDAFDEENMRGVLDYFIKQQKEELDSDGKPLISDESLLGLVFDFVGGGNK